MFLFEEDLMMTMRMRYAKSTCGYFMILALFGHLKVEQIQQRLFDRQEPVRILLEAALAIEAYGCFQK